MLDNERPMIKTKQVKKLVFSILMLSPGLLAAQGGEHSPRISGALEYEVGGGSYVSRPTNIIHAGSLEIGVGWDLNMQCGKFDPQVSVSNQLNGITEGFHSMMSNTIQAATGAVANLPALAIQRANPGLYDILQQGILQGRIDFEAVETSCEAVSNVLMGQESFPFETFKASIKSKLWSKEIKGSGGDAIRAKKALDNTNHGNKGAEWVCGKVAGGSGQASIRVLSDVVQVGYNVLFDRTDSCTSASIRPAIGQGNAMWAYWGGPVEMANWAKRVIGEIEIRTCNGCRKITSVSGKGLTYIHQEITAVLREDIRDIVDGKVNLTWQNLNGVSAPPGVVINAPIIHAIQKRNARGRAEMIDRLASEIAYARMVEQGRILTQVLRTGVKEPNVAAFEPAKVVVNDAIAHLQVELEQLEREIRTKKAIAKNTIQKILGAEEKGVQSVRSLDRGKAGGTTLLGQP